MLFNRFARAAAKQDWSTVAIELFVVVFGIFLGLQADSWNDSRNAKIEESQYLQRLHEDLLVTEALSARVMNRRLEAATLLSTIADTLYGRSLSETMLDRQCEVIAGASYFNINVTPLPSYSELVGTGRLGIIQNEALRSSLVKLQQSQEALSTLILIQTTASAGFNLGSRYPDLIVFGSVYDPSIGEMRANPQCDFSSMKLNQAFLNDFSIMADRYDAYVNDGLEPWSAQLEEVHSLLDSILGYQH